MNKFQPGDIVVKTGHRVTRDIRTKPELIRLLKCFAPGGSRVSYWEAEWVDFPILGTFNIYYEPNLGEALELWSVVTSPLYEALNEK